MGHGNASLFDLAPSGVYQPPNVTTDAVRSYRTLSPLPVATVSGDVGRDLGGLLSAALSVGSHPPGVTWRSALWSPDFPLCRFDTATVWPTPGSIVALSRSKCTDRCGICAA